MDAARLTAAGALLGLLLGLCAAWAAAQPSAGQAARVVVLTVPPEVLARADTVIQ